MEFFSKNGSSVKLKDGNRIGYNIFGKKKNFPIFYFHGWPGSRFELRNIPLKKKNCFVFAIERPGYGISDPIKNFKIKDWPKIVLEIANKFKIKKFSIIGVSGGAPFALSCAYFINSKRLKSVAIVCGLAPSNVKGMNKGRVGMLMNYGNKPIVSWMLLIFLRSKILNGNIEKSFYNWKKKIPLPKKDNKLFNVERGVKLIKNFREAIKYGVTGVHRDANLYANYWGFDVKKINKKIFVWHGDKDLTVPISTLNFYKKNLKNKEIHTKKNEGHFSICYNFMNDIIQQLSE